MATPKQQETSAALAYQIAAATEPKIRAALEAALTKYADSVSLPQIEAFIRAGDFSGLSAYLSIKFGANVAPVVVALDNAVTAAGNAAAAEVTRYLALHGKTLSTYLPDPVPGVPAQIVFQGVTDSFNYNPVNPKTIAAVRNWQGALIQQMTEGQRMKILDHVTAGLLEGENPRQIAVRIRDGLPLTASQSTHVQHFSDDLGEIVNRGIRSAQAWGLYTPSQIKALKASDPTAYRRLNFTATEIAQGRRWGKISRAAGTLAFDPKLGLKTSKPIGFVAPPGTQGGDSAWRRGPDGKLIDGMTNWRLRDKRFDPLIYDVVEAGEATRAAQTAMGTARTPQERDAAAKALAKAEAQEASARAALGAEKATLVDRYRARYVKHRSQTIARTESLRAANLGAYEAWRQAVDDSDLFEPNEVSRIWITARDDRVRDAHRLAAGQKVGMHEAFKIDGVAYQYPPAGVNCRCTVGFRIDLNAGA